MTISKVILLAKKFERNLRKNAEDQAYSVQAQDLQKMVSPLFKENFNNISAVLDKNKIPGDANVKLMLKVAKVKNNLQLKLLALVNDSLNAGLSKQLESKYSSILLSSLKNGLAASKQEMPENQPFDFEWGHFGQD